MGAVTTYSALSGKSRAMFRRLLKETDYNELMKKRSVGEIADYIKSNTHFSDSLEEEDPLTIHRGHLENVLRRSLMEDYGKLISFSTGNVRNFIRVMYMRHEIESLKLLFRTYASGPGNQGLLNDSLLSLSRCARISIPKLAASRNAVEFVAGLEGSDYYPLLRPYISDDGAFQLFNIEMRLDSYYYDRIHDAMKSAFSREDERIVNRLYGVEIDLFNMLTIYRGKVFFQMDRDVINSYLIPYYGTVSKQEKTAMLDAKDRDELHVLIAKTKYAEAFTGKDERWYELNIQNYLYRVNGALFRQEAFSIACVLAYLTLRECELKNIVSLIEGIRYRLPAETLSQYLIGYRL